MIRAVGSKRLNLTDSEYEYFKTIREAIGEADFKKLFSTDKNGIITTISPPLDKPINMAVIYFILNVMVNQRMTAVEGRVENFIKKMDEEDRVNILLERVEAIEARLDGKNE